MKGIFNYQVPGRTPTTNETNAPKNTIESASGSNQFQSNASCNSEQLTNIQSLIQNLLQGILQKLGLASEKTPATPPKCDDGGMVTTQAVGEEDGGIKDPPTITTLALGEEDGGLTTQAVGEEDGGIQDPPTITTFAVGEEDGGITSGKW